MVPQIQAAVDRLTEILLEHPLQDATAERGAREVVLTLRLPGHDVKVRVYTQVGPDPASRVEFSVDGTVLLDAGESPSIGPVALGFVYDPDDPCPSTNEFLQLDASLQFQRGDRVKSLWFDHKEVLVAVGDVALGVRAGAADVMAPAEPTWFTYIRKSTAQ